MIKGKYKEHISQSLKLLLEKNNLSQKDLSKQTGISIATINSYVNGTRNITIERLEAIADYFDVSIDELLDRKPKNTIGGYYREECMKQRAKFRAIEKILYELGEEE